MIKTVAQIAELGLADHVLVKSPNDPGVRNRYIATEDKLFAIPNSFAKIFFKQKPLSKSMARYTLTEYRTPRLDLTKQSFEQLADEKAVIDRNRQLLNEPELEDISVHEFFKLRLGEDFADHLVDPMLRGITSGNARTLSVRSLFSEFFENERAHGSVIRGSFKKFRGSNEAKEERLKQMLSQWNMPDKLKNIRGSSVWSFQDGMAQLPRTLADQLAGDPNVELRTCNRLTGFELDEQRRLTLNVVGEQNYQIKADQVFFALNAQDLAKLIPGKDDQLSLLKSTLSSIESATVATLNFEFAQKDLLKSTPGFGLLIPSRVNTSILGVIFESLLFPQLDRSNAITRLSVIAGGDWFAQLCSSGQADGQVDESRLIEKSLEVLARYLKISQDPSFTKINVLRNCIPQYRVGHYLKLKLLDSLISDLKLSLVGSSYRGISLNDCIFYSKEAVDAYLQSCESQPAAEPVDEPAGSAEL